MMSFNGKYDRIFANRVGSNEAIGGIWGWSWVCERVLGFNGLDKASSLKGLDDGIGGWLIA